MDSKTKTPILAALIKSGHVWLDGSTYFGKAADGVHVQLGVTGEEAQLENYLKHHPTPHDW